jgi:hypothetical protein
MRGDYMDKIQVSKEEFDALNELATYKRDLARNIELYIQNSHRWSSDYKPLRLMGFEKFVKCLVQGYKIEFNMNVRKEIGRITIDYNYDNVELLKTKTDEIIYLKARNGFNSTAAGLTISETKELIKGLQGLLDQLKLIRSDI